MSTTDVIKATFSEFGKDKAPRLAAALAYYTLFSIAPLLVILVTIAGFVYGEQAARGEIVGTISNVVGSDAAEQIQQMIQGASDKKSTGVFASIGGILLLLLGASGVMKHLEETLNAIWSVSPRKRSLGEKIAQRLAQIGMVLAAGIVVLVLLAVGAVVSTMGSHFQDFLPFGEIFWQFINIAVSLAILTLIFALLYRYVPDADIDWGDVWIGAFATAILFVVGKLLIGLYLGKASFGSTYGAASSLVILLLWLYYSSLILFLGAEFTEVVARKRHGFQSREERREHNRRHGRFEHEKGGGDPRSPVHEESWQERQRERRAAMERQRSQAPKKSKGGAAAPIAAGCGGLLLGLIAGVVAGLVGGLVGIVKGAKKTIGLG